MIRTLKEYDEMIDNGTLTPENVIHLYIAARLKPLLLNYKCCTENNLEILAEFIADCFFEQNYSIDMLVNAVINFIDINNTFPMHFILKNDPLALLEDYTNA